MAKRWLEKAAGCFSKPAQGCDDQTSFNALVAHEGDINPAMDGRHGAKPVKGGDGRVYWSEFEDKCCAIGYLPISCFSNGHVSFLQKIPQSLEYPYSIHNTHNFYGHSSKVYRFRASKLWVVEGNSEEYSNELNYLSFESFAGTEASKESSPLVAHILARDELRREIWAAVGLAKALDQVLVLPRFNCFCDRYWYPNLPQCRLPGSQRFMFSQPCPLDQILDIGAVADPGFIVKTRVDGFFEHAKAKPLLESRKVGRLVETREKVKCLSPGEVKKSLASSETVLHITGGIRGLFCGFPDNSAEAKAIDAGISKAFNSTGVTIRMAACQMRLTLTSAPGADLSPLGLTQTKSP